MEADVILKEPPPNMGAPLWGTRVGGGRVSGPPPRTPLGYVYIFLIPKEIDFIRNYTVTTLVPCSFSSFHRNIRKKGLTMTTLIWLTVSYQKLL